VLFGITNFLAARYHRGPDPGSMLGDASIHAARTEHAMRRKLKPTPEFASEAEERRFWESQDPADYV
jgi:hypothetical protein